MIDPLFIVGLVIFLAFLAQIVFGLSSFTTLTVVTLIAVLMGDMRMVETVIGFILANPENYLLMPAFFLLALGRAVGAQCGAEPPSSAWLEARPSRFLAAVRWFIAAIASLPRTVNLHAFIHGRHVSLAMLFPIGIPMLLVSHVSRTPIALLAGMMALPFLVLLALCVLRPPAGWHEPTGAQPAGGSQALPVFAAFLLAFSGTGTWAEATAVAAGLSCLLLAMAAGGRAVLGAQALAVGDCVVLAMIVIMLTLIHFSRVFEQLQATELLDAFMPGGLTSVALLAAAAVLGALVGTTISVAIMLLLVLEGFAVSDLDIVTLPIPLLLATEAGRYARAAYRQASESGGAIDGIWIVALAGLAMASLLFSDALQEFSAVFS